MRLSCAAAMIAAMTLPCVLHSAAAQTACATGAPLAGLVRDTTLAIIPGASVQVDGGKAVTSGSDGRYRFPCVAPGKHTLHVTADSFAVLDMAVTTPRPAELNLTLQPGDVKTTVDVSTDAEEIEQPSATSTGASKTITSKQLSTLADDPDDLLRELQQLSAASGGSPSAATVAVDGFDNGEGGTHLPPKSSIAYIKVNPDLFSAEYRNPPFGGGRIEIYTKPGQSTFHGALFMTNSSSFMNARDPFSTAPASLGKQRYGFELTGPIRKKGSDFFTSLEHRDISNAAVVNAVGVNAAGVQTPILQTVAAPQHMFIGNLKTDWQLGEKNTLIASFDHWSNDRPNFNVGGTNLPENGYDNSQYDENLHLALVTTISPKIMHEGRIGMEWDGYTYAPNSTAPQVSVAGAFTGGGSALGAAHEHEIWSSIIDDIIIQTKNHLIKVGIQPEFVHLNTYSPTNFNGVYTFGGGTTSTGQTLTGIQQYVNALNGAANGSPTSFNNTTGSPYVEVFQFRNALFVQDDWNIRPNVHFSSGVRYYVQEKPSITAAVQPRFGFSYTPDKKATWNLHAHAGMFAGRWGAHGWESMVFYNGTDRSVNTVYTPTCAGAFDPTTCQPLSTGSVIRSVRTLQPGFRETYWSMENLGFSKTLPQKFTLSGDYYITQMWHYARTQNINSPTNDLPTGPRPYGANLNILQMQSSGRGYGNVVFVGLTNQSLKKVQFFAGAVRVDIIDNTDDNQYFTPQTTGVTAGEYARRDNQGLWQIFGNATVHLPEKIQFSANYNGTGLQAYNVTTGFDNNGDGDFNDRPQYAVAGTPLCSVNPKASPCGYNTPWGELVASGGVGSLSRDKGEMPWTFFLDTNLQRTFNLTKNTKADHPQTLMVNLRSSNVLNHLNASAVGSVLGSPNFGQAYAANPGRRVEVGLRYSF
ncbi:Carboxypeptidase regulatory-like domain-containing protein [Bryocella elongata]|uniref:Carboxypeptidase regulatory-like domain-containing protein n=1 Tax=Bryocella elongata TaxID=863522 RepID=A0A1H5XW25_9BACT|nr:carboxypeptidase-like regulatory domain-containing protein [Bryocella elongata]SEG15853.1 Carboxypeptidase regulatory-like domain-containing protein [Bryocella elongata]